MDLDGICQCPSDAHAQFTMIMTSEICPFGSRRNTFVLHSVAPFICHDDIHVSFSVVYFFVNIDISCSDKEKYFF